MKKQTRIVRPIDVDMLTQVGWQVVRILDNVTRIDGHTMIEQEAHYTNGNHVPAKYKVLQAVINEPLFVLEKDYDEIARERALTERLDSLELQVREAYEERDKLTEQVSTLTKRLEAAKRDAKKHEDKAEEMTKLATQHASTIEAMRQEAAKIRRYVGDGRWASIGLELLDGEEVKPT